MISVGDLLQAIGVRSRTAELRALDSLGPADRERVERILARLPPGHVIDIEKLVTELRQQASERQATEAQPDAWAAFAYWRTIATREQLVACRDALVRGASIEAAMQAACAALPEPQKRAWVGRPRPRRGGAPALAAASGAHGTAHAPDDQPRPARRRLRLRRVSEPAPAPALRGLYGQCFGAGDSKRPFGCPIDVSSADYSAWRRPSPPPWLRLVSDADADDEEETQPC